MAEDRPGREGGQIEGMLGRALVAWVGAAERNKRAVLAATAVVTVAALLYTGLGLGINASHRALLSEDLPFWREYEAFAAVFPIVDEAIFVVVDGETPTRAREATAALAERLATHEDQFESVYVPGGGEYFEKHALLYLDLEELYDLSDHLAAVQPLLSELSQDLTLGGLVSVLDTGLDIAKDDETVAQNLIGVFDSVSFAAQAVLEGNPRPISWSEVLLQRSLPGDSSRRLIVLAPKLDYLQLLPARLAIQTIRDEAAALDLDESSGARVRVTGNVALNYEEMILVARGAIFAILGSVTVVAFILFFAFGSKRLVACVVTTLLVGLSWTSAFATFAVGEINVISIAFAVLFIGLGVDFGIHIAMRYAELMREHGDHSRSLAGTASSVGGSLVLCAITTAVGFYVFVPTDYRAVGELGLVSGTGLPISLFCSLTILPALLSVGDTSRARTGRPAPRWFTEVLIPLSVRHYRLVLVGAVIVGAAAVAALRTVDFDVSVARIRDRSAETVQTFEELLADSENSPWTIDLIEPDLATAVKTADALEQLAVVERAVTLADYVPVEQEEKLEVLADLVYFLPEPVQYGEEEPAPIGEQIAAVRSLRGILEVPWLVGGDEVRKRSVLRARHQLDRFLEQLETIEAKQAALESFEESLLGAFGTQIQLLWNALDPETVALADLPEDLSSRMVAPDGRARVEVIPSEDLNDDEALSRFVDQVRELRPHSTGSAVSILEWARATVRSFRQAMVAATLAIAFIVLVLWWRVRDVGLVIAPLALAALLTGGAAGLFGIPFNFVNVVVLPLLLGIGVDSGIHLVHRHRISEQEQLHLSTRQELLSTSTAQAVFFSAITTMASFGSLALSAHGGISTLGQLLLLGVALTVVCNLIVLPALITAVRRDIWEKRD